MTDPDRLPRLAEAWVATYGEDWRFRVQGDAFVHDEQPDAEAHVFAVAPTEVVGFGKGAVFSQTRWCFSA